MTEFREYIEHGWSLVPIQPGQKSPRTRGWNQRANVVTNPDYPFHSAGLAHAYSGTCAVDVDDFETAAEWLAERGVNLLELFEAPDAVHIVSGRSNHGKLLYALPEPLASKTVAKNAEGKAALDFRCATSAGLTVQDVLPPSIHPGTAEPYKWRYGDSMIGDWRTLPELPPELHEIWVSELNNQLSRDAIPDKGASVEELRELLSYQDPDMSRNDWIKVGMAIHHETDGAAEGFRLWDEWSSKGQKYVGPGDLEVAWRSFHDTHNAVTVGFLRQGTTASPDDFDIVDQSVFEDDPWSKAEAERVARFKMVQVGEIARRDPPEWIVDGVLPYTDLAMIYGHPGAGKSFVALDLAFAVAHGLTFFNRTTQKGRVVWIAAEAAGAMRNRAKGYAQARGIELEATDLWVMEQTLSLMDKNDATALIQAVQTVAPTLIVIDTLAAASGGANENSGEDMNVVLAHCRKMHEETGALVLLVHHSGKDASRGARGWSGLKAAVNTELMVSVTDGSPIRRLGVTKQRDGADGYEMAFKLSTVPLAFEDGDTCVVDSLEDAVLNVGEGSKLGGTQKIALGIINELTMLHMDAGDKNPEVAVQEIYDFALLKMPQPPAGTRDRRPEMTRRALTALQDRGYITIRGDTVQLGLDPYE